MTESRISLIDINALKWLQDFCDWCERSWTGGVDKRSILYETVSSAYFETLAVIKKAQEEDSQIEFAERERLSKLWRLASQAVREKDQVAFVIFFEKSKYWLDPAAWTQVNISASQFDLESIDRRIKEIGLRSVHFTFVPMKVSNGE